jgi:hypothetical protein
MSRLCRWSSIAVFLLFTPLASSDAAQVADSVHAWDVFELEMTAEKELSSPYVDSLPEGSPGFVSVTFQREDGEAKGQQLKVTGFWDGGRTWRIRFAPPASGEWSYRSSSTDPGLDGQTGGFRCIEWTDAEQQENATRRGFVRVCKDGPRSGRYFEYADGTPMRWLSFMAKFLRGIDWWTLEPHPELVRENPSPYCGALPGRQYVVFLRWGGTVWLDLRPSSREQQFEYRWIGLGNEQVKQTGQTSGGDIREFNPPEDYPGVEQYKDWVLYVVRK